MAKRKPLSKWNNPNYTHPKLVWSARLDDRFTIEVQRREGEGGDLCVFDHHAYDRELLRERIPLLYGAAYEPDAADIAQWQNRAVEFVDFFSQSSPEIAEALPVMVDDSIPEVIPVAHPASHSRHSRNGSKFVRNTVQFNPVPSAQGELRKDEVAILWLLGFIAVAGIALLMVLAYSWS